METRFRGRVFVDLPGLSAVRDAKGLSQKALEKQSGVTHVNISRIENGQHATIQTATKLARALRVHLDALTTAPPEGADRIDDLKDSIENAEELYIHNPVGGRAVAPDHEEDLAALYAKLAIAKGATEKAIREVVLEAIRIGKAKGWADAQEERHDGT